MSGKELYDDRLAAQFERDDYVLAVVTATKPDFYRRAPLVAAADEHEVPCFVLHTGQHSDDLLGHGLAEYGIEDRVSIDLGVRGGLAEKTAQGMGRVGRFADERENFLFTGLWRKHAHVYGFLESGQCFAELTDSGSMQEELYHVEEAVCLTARFNTDRPETVFDANTNLLAPPVSGEFVRETVEYVYDDDRIRERMAGGPSLYGSDVGERIVSFLADRRDEHPFEWAHERAGFGAAGDREFDYL